MGCTFEIFGKFSVCRWFLDEIRTSFDSKSSNSKVESLGYRFSIQKPRFALVFINKKASSTHSLEAGARALNWSLSIARIQLNSTEATGERDKIWKKTSEMAANNEDFEDDVEQELEQIDEDKRKRYFSKERKFLIEERVHWNLSNGLSKYYLLVI